MQQVPVWLVALVLLVACGGGVDGFPDFGPPPDLGALADDGPDLSLDVDLGPAGSWRAEAPLPSPRQEITVTVHQGRIWLIGGFEDTTPLADVLVYDPAEDRWEDGPPLPAPRHHTNVVSTGDDLYVIGGYQTLAFEPLDTAWVLRDGSDEWEDVAFLPDDRGATAAGAVGDRIVLAGGNGRRNTLAVRTLVYLVAEDRWIFGADIPTPREHLAAVVHDGELWVVAGRENSLSTNRTEVEIYDPALDEWREGPASPTPRGGFDAAILDGFLYAVGGETPQEALDSADRLDLDANRWEPIAPVPTPRHGHGVVALDGRLWVVGGGDRPLFAPVAVVESFTP